jgi:hypothetical protein
MVYLLLLGAAGFKLIGPGAAFVMAMFYYWFFDDD